MRATKPKPQKKRDANPATPADQRAPKDRVLIVCEGAITEPAYFDAMRQDLRLTTIVVKRSAGSAPISVVEPAVRFYQDEDYGFDHVYCLIDQDEHSSFEQAIMKIRGLGKPFEYVVSYPCFEYWLLLHFGQSRMPFRRTGKKSPCDVATTELRKHAGFSEYAHGSRGIYELIKHLTATAIVNAKIVEADATSTGEPNPSSAVYRLVEKLQGLA